MRALKVYRIQYERIEGDLIKLKKYPSMDPSNISSQFTYDIASQDPNTSFNTPSQTETFIPVVETHRVRVIWGTNINIQETSDQFKDFINHHYSSIITEIINSQQTQPSLYLNCFLLPPSLHNTLLNYPLDLIPILEHSLAELIYEQFPTSLITNITLRPYNIGSSVSIHLLNPTLIEKLVTVKGIVTRSSPIIPSLNTASYSCVSCKHAYDVSMESVSSNIECPSCHSKYTLVLSKSMSRFIDKQILKLQELPGSVPAGSMPLTINVYVYNDLCDTLFCGDRVCVTGVMRVKGVKEAGRGIFTNSSFNVYVEMCSFERETQCENINERSENINDRSEGLKNEVNKDADIQRTDKKNVDLSEDNKNIQSINENMQSIDGNIQSINENKISLSEDIQSTDKNIQSINENMQSIDENIQSINENMQSIDGNIQSINENKISLSEDIQSTDKNIQSINENMQSIDENIQSINENMQSINENNISLSEDIQSTDKKIMQSTDKKNIQCINENNIDPCEDLKNRDNKNIISKEKNYMESNDKNNFDKQDLNSKKTGENGDKNKRSKEIKFIGDQVSHSINLDLLSKIKNLPLEILYSTLSNSIAPQIYGHKIIKQAILLQLIGGVRKTNLRGDINILLVGDPGIAKSQILTFVHKVSNRGMYTSGQGSSAVGLTASVSRDPDTKNYILEPGALVLSDNSICCIDEFDKMNETTRAVLHEVMEQQSISISKAGIVTSLNARCSILASCNPIKSKYDHKKSIVENINLVPTLLSRFDVVGIMIDKSDTENDRKIGEHIVGFYGNENKIKKDEIIEMNSDNIECIIRKNENKENEESKKLFLNPINLKDYISECKKISPILTKQSKNDLCENYLYLRQMDKGKSITATTRQLESLIRLAEAHAKMRFSKYIENIDVAEAFRIVRESMLMYAIDPKTGKIDMEMICTGKSSLRKKTLKEYTEKIREKLGRNKIKINDLKKSFNDLGMFDEAIKNMKNEDDIVIEDGFIEKIGKKTI